MRLHNMTIIICSSLLSAAVFAQEAETEQTESILDRIRLPLFSLSENSRHEYLEDEAARALARLAESLWIDEVVVGIEIDSSGAVYDDSVAYETLRDFDWLGIYGEVMAVSRAEIAQFPEPAPGSDSGSGRASNSGSGSASGPHNRPSKKTVTRINVSLNFYDLENGTMLGSLDLEGYHAGGFPSESKAKAMRNMLEEAEQEFKRIYWFSSDIGETVDGVPVLSVGSRQGAVKGMIFDIFAPAWESPGGDTRVSGGHKGFARVAGEEDGRSRLRILRLWGSYGEGSWAVEHIGPVIGLQFRYRFSPDGAFLNAGFHFNARPMSRLDWGLGMQMVRAGDSYGENDFGLGFSGFGMWRFLSLPFLKLGLQCGTDLDLLFKKDDEDDVVSAALFSAVAGIQAEFMVSAKVDVVAGAGYRFGLKTSRWEYSVEDDTYPAYWLNDPPVLDNTGLELSAGVKYYLF